MSYYPVCNILLYSSTKTLGWGLGNDNTWSGLGNDNTWSDLGNDNTWSGLGKHGMD